MFDLDVGDIAGDEHDAVNAAAGRAVDAFCDHFGDIGVPALMSACVDWGVRHGHQTQILVTISKLPALVTTLDDVWNPDDVS